MGDNYKRKKIGIYKILNKINGKFYIGSAINIKSRWGVHRNTLKRGKHHCQYLQRSFNKYGLDNFEFIILEECSKEDLIKKEQFYLDTFKPEYNTSRIAANCLGIKHTSESSLKKSLNSCFRGKFGKDNPASKIIYQYDLNGAFVKKWYSSADIERELGFKCSNIRAACKYGRCNYKFIWTWHYGGDKIEPRQYRNRNTVCKAIQQIDDAGSIVKIFKSQKEAAIFLKVKSNSGINRALKFGWSAYGYKWRYCDLSREPLDYIKFKKNKKT